MMEGQRAAVVIAVDAAETASSSSSSSSGSGATTEETNKQDRGRCGEKRRRHDDEDGIGGANFVVQGRRQGGRLRGRTPHQPSPPPLPRARFLCRRRVRNDDEAVRRPLRPDEGRKRALDHNVVEGREQEADVSCLLLPPHPLSRSPPVRHCQAGGRRRGRTTSWRWPRRRRRESAGQ